MPPWAPCISPRPAGLQKPTYLSTRTITAEYVTGAIVCALNIFFKTLPPPKMTQVISVPSRSPKVGLNRFFPTDRWFTRTGPLLEKRAPKFYRSVKFPQKDCIYINKEREHEKGAPAAVATSVHTRQSGDTVWGLAC